MLITAERVVKIINYAIDCATNAKEMRKGHKQIEQDIKELLRRDDLHEDVLDRLAIIRTVSEDAYRFDIDQDALENLFYEKAKFEFNAKKNKSAKNRMRILRAGFLQRKIVQRERKTEDGIMIEETYDDENENENIDDEYSPISPAEINQRLKDEVSRPIEISDPDHDHESWLPKTKEEEK